ncbi:hypothetical protein ALP96_200177 [Pseudomonas savastanoi pv. glycinea]|uniref:Uncharacterized protein n=1 Tax=Pseudomonas savastanoi TaxID=29438 RepID=A0A3M5BEC7_PSESS|nr:hypothetical protein ALQ21_200141 [Pseudomonas savastanoi pv. glycinea]RMQ85381.1 hypothetical protein ALP95_200134 [Pseudomonas savastanoi pv. glycinea]RMQ93888.1 hypothetical protein ALP96_200177 [Pseudomonas savastanoi pv. glycinea]RMS23057.1 hypothetical protein ALP70_200180 [Pseudomonas savastanoi]RMU88405.1 hypothetical protein ALP22_200152 [Pseudomonas coronafaciens pv. porri]
MKFHPTIGQTNTFDIMRVSARRNGSEKLPADG